MKGNTDSGPIKEEHCENEDEEDNGIEDGGEEKSVLEYLVSFLVFLFDEVLGVVEVAGGAFSECQLYHLF